MRTFLFAFIAAFIAFASFGATHASAHRTTMIGAAKHVQLFQAEPTAQAHCPSDEVVWLNTNSGIYHEKGMRWYGHTKHGAFLCRKEADAAGYRDTRNGQ